ncbi:AraC family ligand binding domain-containing protein, partial [Streptomyces galbus]
MAARQEVTAWRPRVRGVTEVFHAHFTEYAYPMHVHDAWTLLIVDDGAVRYDLERHEHGTVVDDEQRPGVVHVHRVGVLG